ncbi:MipA/OmpV family protein [Jinshanibacter sp. LJY008]|uniref:MipA/OmpV family protein n=1 Tax=Limnobaculum eriocheiris TaxID=2897391 RepID=A0A9X1SKU2_9GAMM|nr:MipA/OmpV family protein [Limnobaculum eriocheiris]MCD1126050.1 MipA/OmpV family protein [Limnobaculum eriocheiris]
MKLSRTVLSSCILGALLVVPVANADTWSIGAGAAVEMYPYKGVDNTVLPLPMINYEGERFYIHAIAAGAYVWKDSQNQLSLDLYYFPLRFRASESDDRQMKKLDDRDATMMGGASYKHTADWGIIRTSFSADLLDKSNGLRADAAYLYPFVLNDLKLTPGVGAVWYSSNFNDYYYGVSGKESNRSGLDKYEADSSLSPYAELTATYKINNSWNTYATGRYTRLTSEVKDSPMVDKSYSAIVAAGVTYTF